jgi:uncharacterized membrane protein
MAHRLTHDALIESQSFRVRNIPMLRPLGWLGQGWKDFMACPMPGMAHGAVIALFGAILINLARNHFWLLAGAFTGFLLVAPIVATGLYAISRALDRGEKPTLQTALDCWKPNDGRLIIFGLLLGFAGTGWVMTSASLITGLTQGHVDTLDDFLRRVVLAREGIVFELWLAVGAMLAAPMFASTVVAIPLLLDRQVGVLAAVFTSWKVVLAHPGPMALWAGLLIVMTTVGMSLALVGLVVVVPWLSHASWHAYRDLVDSGSRTE